jgi:tripartite ATP-independent transporter DctM subunit
VLGAILFGLATPHEAAAVGALGALLLAMAYRRLTWKGLKASLFLTTRTTAMVCWLFVGSWIFSSVFSILGGHHLIEEWALAFNLSPLMMLILIQIIIFVLGWPLEWTEIIIIFVPIFLPIIHLFGIDPLLFGILIALNIQTSFNTPPMAMASYYLKGVAPSNVQLVDIFKGSVPFVGLVFVAMILIYIFPGIALWLPHVLYN